MRQGLRVHKNILPTPVIHYFYEMKKLAREFIEQCTSRMDENTVKIFSCLEKLHEEDIWLQPNESSNSIANIILHLCGNIRQYAISSLDHQADTRERDKEFSARGGYTKEELKNKLASTVMEAIKIIRASDKKNLRDVRSVQGYSLSGMGIIIHVTEHYSYHTGQIVLLTKLFKNKDLGFYSGIDLNKKNISE